MPLKPLAKLHETTPQKRSSMQQANPGIDVHRLPRIVLTAATYRLKYKKKDSRSEYLKSYPFIFQSINN